MHTVTVAERPTLESTTLGPGRWHEVSQQWVDQFADAAQAINYGLGKARFPALVPVGSRGSARRDGGHRRRREVNIPLRQGWAEEGRA